MTNVAGWDNSRPVETAPVSTTPRIIGGDRPVSAQRQSAQAEPIPAAQVEKRAEEQKDEKKEQKKGFFRRLWGVFK
jgi:hypothetical protein